MSRRRSEAITEYTGDAETKSLAIPRPKIAPVVADQPFETAWPDPDLSASDALSNRVGENRKYSQQRQRRY